MGNQSIQEIKIINAEADEHIIENKYKTQRTFQKLSILQDREIPSDTIKTARYSNNYKDTIHTEFNRKQIKENHIGVNQIKSQSTEESENFEVIKENNTELENYKLIDICFSKHFFMQNLDSKARKEIIREMSLVKVPSNSYVFKEGTTGNYYYILQKGQTQLIINNNIVKEFKIGQSFGELALLHNSPRSGSVFALTDCFFWILSRSKFRQIVDHITEANYEENKQFLDSLRIVSNLEDFQKAILSNALYKEKFHINDFIVKRGERADCIYIIKEGEVACINENKEVVRVLRSGDNFGERGILLNSKRTMDVIAKTDCVCFSISTSTLNAMLSQKYRSCLFLNFMQKAFSQSNFFNKFDHVEFEQVFRFFQAVNLGKDNVAYPKGHLKSSKIVIVIDGNLKNVCYLFITYSQKQTE